MLYPDLSLITSQNAGQNAQYAAAAAAVAAGGQAGTVVSVSGSINNPTPIVAPSYPGAYHTALTAGGHQVGYHFLGIFGGSRGFLQEGIRLFYNFWKLEGSLGVLYVLVNFGSKPYMSLEGG